MEFFSASSLRLVAHLASLSLVVALAGVLWTAKERNLDGRYYRLGCTALLLYGLWFFLLAISVRDTELLRRGELAWLFGATEMAGASGGWAWLALTASASFRIVKHKPARGENHAIPTLTT